MKNTDVIEEYITEYITQDDCDIWHRGELSKNLKGIFTTLGITKDEVVIHGSPSDPEFIIEVY